MEANEEPMESAKREIREEDRNGSQSMATTRFVLLGTRLLYRKQLRFFGTRSVFSPLEMDEDEFLQVERIPIPKVLQMIADGEFHDGKSLAALGLLLQKGGIT
jgi:ADP-ribose pyrophosphatase